MNKVEHRIHNCPIELRSSDSVDSRTVEGYGFKYNVWSKQLYGFFREQIAPGALEGADMSDIKAYFNHDPNYLLARTISGTLNVSNDEIGLRYAFDAPDTSYANDLLQLLKRKDIQHSSFSFMILADEWGDDPENKGGELRTITRFAFIDDVSPVSNPAYPDATSWKRSMEDLVIERQKLRGATDAEVRDFLLEYEYRKRQIEILKLK